MNASPQLISLPSSWHGLVQGTNSGFFRLRLSAIPGGIWATGELKDSQSGWLTIQGTGQVSGGTISLQLTSPDPRAPVILGIVVVDAEVQADGRLSGKWSTGVGTSGTLEATMISEEENGPGNAIDRASILERHIRIPSCALNPDVLARVHAVLTDSGAQAARLYEQTARMDPRIDPTEVKRYFRVGVIVRGVDGEVEVTNTPGRLSLDDQPHPIKSIEFEVGLHFRTMLDKFPPNRATLKLDFERPPAFGLNNLSGFPTENDSRLSVFGEDKLWVAGVFEQTQLALKPALTRTGWLHLAHTYDVFLWSLGFPLACASAAVFGAWVPAPSGTFEAGFRLAFAIYVGFLALVAFRLSFGLIRWMLPYVEYGSLPEPIHRRLRILAAAVAFAIVTGVLVSALWQLFGNSP